MRAVRWQARRKVSVDTVPDPAIKEPSDAIIRVTSTNICGSDLHLYEVLGAFMSPGDILGHEAMGVVEEVYGEVAGGEAEYLRVPQARYTHIKVPQDGPDERYVYLSDVLPTAWQAVEYANVPPGGTLVILGMGPIGSIACRVAHHLNDCRVIGVDIVPERLQRAREMCS